LRRDRKHRVLGGVASGIARTYGIDVVLVRVLWILAAVAWIGIPAYIVAWIAIPCGDGDDDGPYERRDFGMVLALALIGIGLLVALHQLVPSAWRFGRIGGPVLLIGAGVAILVLRRPGDDDEEETTELEQPDQQEVDAPELEPAAVTGGVAVAAEAAPTPTADAPASAWTQTQEWPTPPSRRDERRDERRARRRTRPRPFLTPVALSVLLIGAGVTALLQASGAVDVNITVAFAIATLFVGAVLVLSTWVGRAHGLIAVGILLAALTAASSAIDVPLRGGFGDRLYRPTTAATTQSTYHLAAGRMTIDLRQLSPEETPSNITATVGFGELDVDVTTAVNVVVDAHAGAGNLEIFGIDKNGWDVSSHESAPGTSSSTLTLNLKVGAGHILVKRYDGSIETFPRGTP
jgi:phage shock protein PspC (stress-responsive transcriptional regulator)